MKRGSSRPSKASAGFVRVLFLSTGNAARSPIAEAIFLSLSRGAAAAWSAGVAPAKEIHPMAQVAVRTVFGGRIDHQLPGTIANCGDTQFDYVITLSREAADQCPSFDNVPERLHWELDDPAAAAGTRAQRQRAFDRVTRDIVKRLRRWWLSLDVAKEAATQASTKPRRRRSELAHWRTRPSSDAPVLAVAFPGPPRRCTRMCALFERSGFQVICGEEYGRAPDLLPVTPHGIIVRVDGSSDSPDVVRPAFQAVKAFRVSLAGIPILMLGDRVPSERERSVLEECDVNFIHLGAQARVRNELITTIESLVRRH